MFCFLVFQQREDHTNAGFLIIHGKKVKFCGIFGDKIAERLPISREFHGNFLGKLGQKAISEKTAEFVVIF